MEVEWIHFKTVDSTNAWVRKNAHSLDPSKLTCVLAEHQTAGYGTRGKDWVSKKGNLHLSLFFVLPLDDERIPNLGQLLSYACIKALPKEVQIKWPNDLVYHGKKLCGVLVEALSLGETAGLILGLGMNVNAQVRTDQATTSLLEITKEHQDIEQLSQVIIHQFQIALNGGFAPIKSEYENRLAYKDQRVRFSVGDKQVEGILTGLDERGRLLIENANGEQSTFSSGDIQSLRSL